MSLTVKPNSTLAPLTRFYVLIGFKFEKISKGPSIRKSRAKSPHPPNNTFMNLSIFYPIYLSLSDYLSHLAK